jgi:hypothetical protein
MLTTWKPEHVVGVMVAVVVGAVTGLALGYFAYAQGGVGPLRLTYWLSFYTGDVVLWAVMGAVVVGGAAYAWRLLSR